MNKDELIACAEAKSDQLDADNLIGGITLDVTIKAVQRGPSAEQPLQLVLDETEKFYRPSKTMRRALIGCFGDEPANWIGKRIRLIRNPETTFGGVKVGGIEVSHASIAAPLVLMLSAKRGKKTAVKIDVLQTQKAAPKAKTAPAPVAAPEPKPQDKPHARGTISGDADEGDLSMIPMVPKADMDKMLAAFAKIGMNEAAVEAFFAKPLSDCNEKDMLRARIFFLLNSFKGIGMDSVAVEKEYNKPLKDWTAEDLAEAREVFKECKAEWELKQAAEATQDLI